MLGCVVFYEKAAYARMNYSAYLPSNFHGNEYHHSIKWIVESQATSYGLSKGTYMSHPFDPRSVTFIHKKMLWEVISI